MVKLGLANLEHFHACNDKSAAKTHIKIQNKFQNSFFIAFTIHELGPVSIFIIMTATSNIERRDFCEFYPFNLTQRFQIENCKFNLS